MSYQCVKCCTLPWGENVEAVPTADSRISIDAVRRVKVNAAMMKIDQDDAK